MKQNEQALTDMVHTVCILCPELILPEGTVLEVVGNGAVSSSSYVTLCPGDVVEVCYRIEYPRKVHLRYLRRGRVSVRVCIGAFYMDVLLSSCKIVSLPSGKEDISKWTRWNDDEMFDLMYDDTELYDSQVGRDVEDDWWDEEDNDRRDMTGWWRQVDYGYAGGWSHYIRG